MFYKFSWGGSLCVESLLSETLPSPFADAISHDLLDKFGLQVVGHILDPLPQVILSLRLGIAIHALLHERKQL